MEDCGPTKFLPGFANDHALARRQAVRFDDQRQMEQVNRFHGLLLAGGDGVRRSRYLVPLHEAFSKSFTAFQLGRFLRWAEGRDTAPLKFVHQSQRQGQFGANHYQIRALRRGHP
jgi:hypothetical protein